MQDEIIDTIIEMMQALTTMPVRRAVNPAAESICVEKGTSDVIRTALNRSTIEEMTCVVNGKGTNLVGVRAALGTIHQRLSRCSSYPKNNDWQITAIETVSGPTTIGREAGGLWLLGSMIRIKFYNKEGAF